MTAQLVAEFNRLPREEWSPSGRVRNHWHISIRHVPLNPSSEVLFLVNTEARFVHAQGPARILHLVTLQERAAVVLPMLLKSFTTALNTGLPPTAPWEWSTRDRELARALQYEMAQHGVRNDLTSIRSGTPDENFTSDHEWLIFVNKLVDVVRRPPPPEEPHMNGVNGNTRAHRTRSF